MEIKLPHQYEDFWNGKVVPNLKKNIRTVHELNSVLNDIQDGLNESEVKFSILEDFQTVEKKLDLTKEKFFDEVLPFMCEKALGITKFKDINYLTPVDVPRRYTNKTPAKPPVTTTPTPTKTPTKAPTQTNKTPSTPQTSTKQIHLPPHAKTNDTIRKEWEYEASLDEATRRKRYNVKPVTIDKVVSWDKYPKGFTANPKSKFKVNDEINKKVAIFSGSVVHMEVDGIVNAANEALRGGGGVDGATHAAAGGKLKQEGIVIGGCDPGDVKITRGYNLPAKYVLNAVAPRGIGKNRENEPLLESCYRKCLELAKEFEIRTLAFCCLGVGIFNYPLKDATKSALRITREFLEIGNNKDSFDKIIFVQFAQKEMDMYEKYMPSYFPKTQKISAGENDNLNPIIDMVLTERSVELSREHVLSLMANAFFGTFNISPSGSQAKKFFLAPLFEPGRGPHYLFILNYFIRMMEERKCILVVFF
jgi:O-acetyl-ADP-ribose deacetylase